MCANVSFFKRLFGGVCYASDYNKLKDEFEIYKQNTNNTLTKANEENMTLQNKLSKVNGDLELAVDKLKHHNDLLEEHSSLRASYNQLRSKFADSVTRVSAPTPVTTVTDTVKKKVLHLKYTNKKGYAFIAKAVKLTEPQVRAIITADKESKKP